MEINNFFELLGVEDTPVESSNILGKPSGNTGGNIFDMVWGAYQPRVFQPQQAQAAPAKGGDSFDTLYQKVIQAESRGKHRNAAGELTTSPVGAKGISQVMPKTGVDPGYGVAPLKDDSEKEYLRFGKDLLRAYTNELGGDVRKGVAAYNHGIGAVQKKINRYGDEWETKLPAETKKYLKTILG